MTVELRRDDSCHIPSVYFSQGYGNTVAREQGGEWVVCASSDGRWQIPLIKMPICDGTFDAVSPYGYSGIFVDDSVSSNDIPHLWSESLEILRQENIVSMFLRFSPFLRQPYELLTDLPDLYLDLMSETVSVLIDDEEAMWMRMKGRTRTAVRKAKAAGLTSRVDVMGASLEDGLEAFKKLYDSTMDRLNARSQYRFSSGYYHDLVKSMGGNLAVVSVQAPNGQQVAACLVLQDGERVHYHLSGSDLPAARQGANCLMIWDLLNWARETGAKLAHLGGGRSGDDSLMNFKESFGGKRHGFYIGKTVINYKEYSNLLEVRSKELGCSVEQLSEQSFFPAYRAEVGEC